jgi:hypothetical protein
MMNRFCVLLILLAATAADAAPWSSRWMISFKSAKADGSLIITTVNSPRQLSSRINSGSAAVFYTTTQAFYTASVVGADVQVDIQPQTGAAANALGLRTGWVVSEARTGTGVGATYYIKLTNDPLDAVVDPKATVELFFSDPTQFGLFAPSALIGTKLYVDWGSCNATSTCGTTL